MICTRDHDRQPLARGRLGEAVIHLGRFGDPARELGVEVFVLLRIGRVEHGAHEEVILAGVLVEVGNVEPGLGQEAADRGDQAGPVGARDQQTSRLRWRHCAQ